MLTCLTTYRVLSLTYGRPLMIYPSLNQSRVILPLAIDDEHLSSSPGVPGCQPATSLSLTECYVQAVKLQDILGRVLATFYNRDIDNPEAVTRPMGTDRIRDSDLQMLLNVDASLSEWHKTLPSYLKVQSYRDGDASSFSADPERVALFKRQATVLEAR